MTYSYTQISQYLSCPAATSIATSMAGRRKTPGRPCCSAGRSSKPWAPTSSGRMPPRCSTGNGLAHRESGLHYSERDSWDRMSQSGVQLLDRFAQDDRIRIRQPRRNLQIKYTTPLAGQNDFVAYVDAIGELDGTRCLLEWKTTASRYPEEPAGLLALDPQLVCYSWVTGIADVAQVVFVRKRLVEIQYFRTTISDAQREEFGHLVQDSIRRIEVAEFLPHSGIRFPQNPCTSCPYIGLCLGRPDLTEAALVRRPGADDLGWLDELTY